MNQLSPELLKILKRQFRLDPNSPHGPNHWMRVQRNGMELSEKTGANKSVVQLFSVFHDSCRENDVIDPNHGSRGAKLAKKLFKMGYVDCTKEELETLVEACKGHTGGDNPSDATIATCWDADRLDLPRVGIEVNPELLCTPEAREPDFIETCRKRAGDWQLKTLPERNDDWELSSVRKVKNERIVIYLSGRGGDVNQGGLGSWLKGVHPNRIGLSVNDQFLALDFEKQVKVVSDLFQRLDRKETIIIANSYGAYLALHAMLKMDGLESQVVLLSPVMGRGVAKDSMFMSRPPWESVINKAIEEGSVFAGKDISVHVGEFDDSENIVSISDSLGIQNVDVVAGAGHNLPVEHVQKLIRQLL